MTLQEYLRAEIRRNEAIIDGIANGVRHYRDDGSGTADLTEEVAAEANAHHRTRSPARRIAAILMARKPTDETEAEFDRTLEQIIEEKRQPRPRVPRKSEPRHPKKPKPPKPKPRK